MKVLTEKNIETLDGKSMDVVADNIEKLRAIFPEVFCEDKIDFEKLQEVLGNYIEDKEERYRFEWNGKSQAVRIAQTQSTGTLRPCKEESKNWDTTQNLYIEGDNLEVLKLLQKSYQNKIKMIYIDPPYNTGNDFVYKDDYSDNIKNYLFITGQLTDNGAKTSTNSESSGRYHTEWLNMIYPRLRLAKNLLSDNGVIFISIDENEYINIKKVCDEIFGEQNSLQTLIWKKKYTGGKHSKTFADFHEYIVGYCKDINLLGEIMMERPNDEKEKFEYEDEYVRERGKYYIRPLKSNLDPRPTLVYPIEMPDGTTITTQWIVARDTFESMVKENRILFKMKRNGEYQVYKKYYENDGGGKVKIPSILDFVSNNDAKEELKSIFEIKQTRDLPFQTPKPTKLLKFLVDNFTENDDYILDFFSGSASTADSVIKSNLNNNTRKKFIMVQLQELLNQRSKIYKNICEIGKERIRRVGDNIVSENKNKKGIKDLDIGFKVLKLDSSNIKKWNPNYDNLEQSFDDMLDNFVPNRTEEDVVYEIMLKYGIDLTYPVEEKIINGKKVFSVGFGALIICLDNDITLDVIEGIVKVKKELSPEVCRIVFKDNGFANDSVKTNAIQILRRNNIKEVMSI